jgi:hypothetical protein
MTDALNRIAPATVPLSQTDRLKREREEKNPGAGKRDKPPKPAGDVVPTQQNSDEAPEAEKDKGKHVNISV